jgi:hypothetical protein
MKIISLFMLVLLLPCSCRDRSTLEVRSLLAKASTYNGKIIAIHGCYSQGMEDTVLSPCTEHPQIEESIWIEFYSKIEWADKVNPGGVDSTYKKPERKPNEYEDKLAKSLFIPGRMLISVPVVFCGQFRSSEGQEYGHLSKYKYELVLHRVISVGR